MFQVIKVELLVALFVKISHQEAMESFQLVQRGHTAHGLVFLVLGIQLVRVDDSCLVHLLVEIDFANPAHLIDRLKPVRVLHELLRLFVCKVDLHVGDEADLVLGQHTKDSLFSQGCQRASLVANVVWGVAWALL